MSVSNINMKKAILITGSSGFIGSSLVTELLKTEESINLIGKDNMNDYYDVSIKEYRLRKIEQLASEKPNCKWTFIKGNIADKTLIDRVFEEYKPNIVVNLAAQEGVRYSIDNSEVHI